MGQFVLAWLALVILLLPAVTTLLAVPESLHGYPIVSDSVFEAIAEIVMWVALLLGVVVIKQGYSLTRLWSFAVVAFIAFWIGAVLIDAIAGPSGFAAYPGLLSASVLFACLLAYLSADFLVYKKVQKYANLL